MDREAEEAEEFLARQIAWGHKALGAEIHPQLRWVLANRDLKPEEKPSQEVVGAAVAALSKAWDEGPEGVRSKDASAAWQKHAGQILRKSSSSGSRLVLASWLRRRAPGSLPEDRLVLDMGGFGTSLFGMEDLRGDDSYVATKFVVALSIPVVPLGTFRVKEGPRSFEMGMALAPKSYEVLEEHPIRWAQAFRGWAFAMVCVLLIILPATLVEDGRWGVLLLLAALTFPWASQRVYTRLRRRLAR